MTSRENGSTDLGELDCRHNNVFSAMNTEAIHSEPKTSHTNF